MKSGAKKVLFFEIIVILLLIVNNFVSSILSSYLEIAFIIVLMLIFYFMFGFEKDRHHLWKTVCLEIVIFLLTFFLLYYLLGIVVSFGRVNNFFTWQGIVAIFIPIILITILKEIFRYMLLSRCSGYRLLYVLTCILFIMIDLVGVSFLSVNNDRFRLFVIIAVNVLPIISNNILCSYISYNVGYKPSILYLLIVNLYSVVIPIIPNPNQYLYSIIWLIVPFVLMYRLYKYFQKEKHEYVIESKRQKKKILSLIFPLLIVLVLVYFISGYFHHQAIVIVSGSMEKTFSRGDIVIVEKNDPKSFVIGDVVAYRYNGNIIVHRFVKKITVDGEVIYYSKGDANNAIDNYKITEDMVIGKVISKIPYIGYPTVWVKEL